MQPNRIGHAFAKPTVTFSEIRREIRRMSDLEQEVRRRQKVYCHLNTYLPPSRIIEVYSSKNALLDDLRLSIQQGKRCYVTSNSKKFVEGVYESFTEVFKKKKFRLVVSELGDDQDNRAFLKDIRTKILEYDAVMCSPSIGTGVDITFPNKTQEIDVVYGFFEADVNTHFDIDQQLGRVRHPGEVKVWINPRRQRLSLSAEKIRQELASGREVPGLTYFLDQEGVHVSRGSHPLLDLLTQVIITRRRSMNSLRENFMKYKRDNGWRVHEIAKDFAKAQVGRSINKASVKTRKKAVANRLVQAPDLGFKDFTRLRDAKERQDPLSDIEKASLNKYWLKRFYHQDVTEELVKFDQDGKMRDRIRLFEHLTDPAIPFVDYSQIREDGSSLVIFKLKIDGMTLKRVVFLREVLSVAGLFDLTTFQFNLTHSYGNENLRDFIAFVRRYRERYLHVFDKDIHENLDEKPVTQVGSILTLIGLKGKVVKKNKGKNSGPSRYQIDRKQFDLIQGIVKVRRESKVDKDESPVDDKNIPDDVNIPGDMIMDPKPESLQVPKGDLVIDGDPDIDVEEILKRVEEDPGV